MRIILAILLMLTTLPAFAQRFVEEVPSVAAMKARNVHNINLSVFARGTDGGIFTVTNSNIFVDGYFRIASTFDPAWSYDRWMPPIRGSFNFGDQFDVNQSSNINLANGFAVTNLDSAGAFTLGQTNLGVFSGTRVVNASVASSYTLLLTGNSTLIWTNYPDRHPIMVTVTNAGSFTLTFSNSVTPPLYWRATGSSTPLPIDQGAGIVDEFDFWKTGGRILAGKSGLSSVTGGTAGQVAIFNPAGQLTGNAGLTYNTTTAGLTNTGTLTSSNLVTRLNVQWWGADPTGVADSTAAFTAAFANADVVGDRGHVYIPAGTYKVTSVPFNTIADLVIEGDSSLNHTIITGGTNGYPMFDLTTCERMVLRDISFTPGAGITPSCAILLGRDNSNTSAGMNTFERIMTYGNFSVASVYGISAEVNLFSKCWFNQNAGDTNSRTGVYLAKDCTNIYGADIKSLYHSFVGAGIGGNGMNVFDECTFGCLSTNQHNSLLVVEFGQLTTLRSCFLASSGATNQIILGKGTTGFYYDNTGNENQSSNRIHGIAILDPGIYQDIRISGTTWPIYAVAGVELSDVRVDHCLLGGVDLENAIDVDAIRNSVFRFSEQVTQFGTGVTNFVFNVRGECQGVDFGVPSTRVTIAGNTNIISHYGNHFFDDTVSIGTITNLLYSTGSTLVYSNGGVVELKIQNASGFPIVINQAANGSSALFSGGNLNVFYTDAHANGIEIDSGKVVPTFFGTSGLMGLGSGTAPWNNLYLTNHIIWNQQTNSVFDLAGNGSPDGVVTASPGSTYRRYEGGSNTTFYVKTTGTGNTGWTAISSAGLPVSVANGGTGNDLSLSMDGAIPFFDLTAGAFTNTFSTYSNYLAFTSGGRLDIAHRHVLGNPLLFMSEGSGGVPTMSGYVDKFVAANTNLSLDVSSGRSVRARINGINGLEVTEDLSVLIGDGTTTTTRTNKFLYLPTSAGPPTGAPRSETGFAACVFDTVNTNIYVYNGSWLKFIWTP